jgi:hypothetical protein
MPRPKEGYKNSAGLPIPGTSDITGRFMNRSRLLYWAFNRGKQGHAKLYDDSALDIGTAVHMMAELDLNRRPQSEIEFYLNATLRDDDQRQKAILAFAAFRKWRADFHVTPHVQEVSMVSEKLQYGGTIDTVAIIQNELGLLDFKTSSSGEVYEDHLLQLAAYGILWEENHPREALTAGYHLVVLPKDGSKPVHRAFTHDQMNPFRQKFWLYRKAFDLDVICNNPQTLKGEAVKTAPKPKAAKAAPKPRERIVIDPPKRGMTMAEILMTYGHIPAREGVRA